VGAKLAMIGGGQAFAVKKKQIGGVALTAWLE
jgi:hypothetical protein